MNKEIEVKVLEIDKDKLIERLESIGARKTRDEEMNVRYYRLDHRENKFVRIRSKWDEFEFAYKQKILWRVQKNNEVELMIDDKDAMNEILNLLWLKKFKERKKWRISYTDDVYVYDFDKYANLPRYLDLEWPSEEALFAQIELLWLQDNPTTSLWYSDLIKNYQRIVKDSIR